MSQGLRWASRLVMDEPHIGLLHLFLKVEILLLLIDGLFDVNYPSVQIFVIYLCTEIVLPLLLSHPLGT